MKEGEEEDPEGQIPYHQFIKEAIQRFAQRWGGLEQEVFLRVLQQAPGRPRLLAMFALGMDPACTNATTLLAPFLTSQDHLERSAAACLFALRRDERAFSVLEEYLLCEPPADPQGEYLTTPDASIWYANMRCRVARLLAEWGPPSFVPVLRQACLNLYALEDQYEGNVYDQTTQDALCYSLGRRGALAAFHGSALPEQRRRIALIFLALGALRADERFERMYDAILLNRPFIAELTTLLMEQFALSAEESTATIDAYPTDIGRRRYATYGLGEMDETPIIVTQSPQQDQDA